MSSFSTLSIGATALTAAQRGVETAAHNIANSTVEGYTRQRLNLAAAAPTAGSNGVRGSGMVGAGVQVVSLQRLRSDISDLATRAEAGTAGGADARATVLDRAQGVLGPYGNGVPESLTGLWDAFSALANDPSGSAARGATIDAAKQVAGGLNDAAGQLARIRSDTTTQLGDEVTEVNSLTSSVAGLNRQISDAVNLGQAPNDLMDSRDVALDRLAALTGATSTARPDGMVDVRIGGVQVVDGAAATQVALGSNPPPAGSVGADPVLLVAGTTQAVPAGGSIGGQVSALGGDLRDVELRLDAVASAVAGTVNAQHAKGFDLAGQAGGAFFTGSTAADLAVDPALTPDRVAAAGSGVAGGNPLDGTAATALSRLRQAGADGASLNSRVVGLATLLGSRAADAARTSDAAATSLDGLQQQRSAFNGVSVDEEMIDLVKFQHSYDAASRVISIADGMLDTIINRMGAGR